MISCNSVIGLSHTIDGKHFNILLSSFQAAFATMLRAGSRFQGCTFLVVTAGDLLCSDNTLKSE